MIYLDISQSRPYTCSAAAIGAHSGSSGLGLSRVGEMMPRHPRVGISRTKCEFMRTLIKTAAVTEYPKVTLALCDQRKSAQGGLQSSLKLSQGSSRRVL